MNIALKFRLLACLFFVCFCIQPVYAQNKEHNRTDSLQDCINKHYLKPSALIIPGSFLIYSGLTPAITGIQKLDDSLYMQIRKNHPAFHTNAEEYLMWAPSASIYIMDAVHLKTQHNFKEHLILDATSIIITGGAGYIMRLISKNISSYNTYHTQFPSGHTANAFRSAEFFHQELKNRNPVLSYGGYLVATSVGVLRIYNKDHLLSQVLAGAGLGILSTKVTYWIFDKIKCKKKTLQPNTSM